MRGKNNKWGEKKREQLHDFFLATREGKKGEGMEKGEKKSLLPLPFRKDK